MKVQSGLVIYFSEASYSNFPPLPLLQSVQDGTRFQTS
jgi:hypothetical protein